MINYLGIGIGEIYSMRCKACDRVLNYPKQLDDGREEDMCSVCVAASGMEWNMLEDKTYQHDQLKEG